jgi:hypothetical protein
MREDVGAVDLGGVAVAFQSAEDRCAGDLQVQAFLNDGVVERFALITVAFREMETEQFSRPIVLNR